MELTHIIFALLLNKVALQHAFCVACVVAPLYTFVIVPLICQAREAHHRQTSPAPVSTAAAPLHGTPDRPSARASAAFHTPASAGAAPMDTTPIFAAAPAERRSRRLSVGGEAVPPLEVIGTAIHAPTEVYRSSTESFVSALRRQVHQRGAALLGYGEDNSSSDEALRAAIHAGEVHFQHPPRGLPSQDYLALRLLNRQHKHALYDELNITDASLKALYASPKFQEWYDANRDELHRDARLRDSFAQRRSAAKAVVLGVALLLLPAFSFSTQTNATQWRTQLTAADSAAMVAAAPLAQLLWTRMHHIHTVRPKYPASQQLLPFAPQMSTEVRRRVSATVDMIEWVGIVAAVCFLVRSCLASRKSRRNATAALVSFVLLLVEASQVSGVSVKLGLGFLIILGTVIMSIRQVAAAQ